MRILAPLALTLGLVACGSIERTAVTSQPLGKIILAGPGDVVLRVDRERSLENIVGKADMFGRKTKEGYSEIRFAGVEPSGVVVLYRKDVSIVSNETTMSRTPFSMTTGSSTTTGAARANSYGSSTQVTGAATTTGLATTIGTASAYTIAIPSDTVPIRLEPKERRLPVAGYVVEILSVTANSIEFRLAQQQ